MIYTPLTVKALKIAYEAHQGQYDKSGIPYIFHPYHLAEQMDNEYTICIALLHDVIEDTSITIQDLEKEFPVEITEAIKLLTHTHDDKYEEYIVKIKENELAKIVKLADLKHNLDESRLTNGNNISNKEQKRLREKYLSAMELLK